MYPAIHFCRGIASSGSFARSEIVDLTFLLLLICHRHVSTILATWDYKKLRCVVRLSVLSPPLSLLSLSTFAV